MNYEELMRESAAYLKQSQKGGASVAAIAEQFSYHAGYYGYLFGAYFCAAPAALWERLQNGGEESVMKECTRKVDDSEIWAERHRIAPFFAVATEADLKGQEEAVFEFTCGEISKKETSEDRIALWHYDREYRFHYSIGSPVKCGVPANREGEVIKIGGGEYLVLSMKDRKAPICAENLKKVVKYAYTKAQGRYGVSYDKSRCCHILFRSRRAYLYIPLQLAAGQEKKKKYTVDMWTGYIDEHIKEEGLMESLAKTFNYSPGHFRRVFQIYYAMSVKDYIRKRRLSLAAAEIAKGRPAKEAAGEYGFSSYRGFSKAFEKEFHTSPQQYKKARFEAVDLNQYYKEHIGSLKVSYMNIGEIKMIGRTVIPDRGQDVDIPAQVAYWIKKDFPDIGHARRAYDVPLKDDRIAMWYHDPDQAGEEINIEYILGPVVEQFKDVPKEMVPVTIEGGYYAIFETGRERDWDDMAETIRMFSRCVFYGWLHEHRDQVDLMRFTFERYVNDKIYIYLPLLS